MKTWETYLIMCESNDVIIDRDNNLDKATEIAQKWAAAGYKIKLVHHTFDFTTFEIKKTLINFQKTLDK
jgi:hypothetical protein